MARKITIRRVGGFLPAICLVALILLVTALVWLSTAGLPQSVLRSIEADAAQEGIYLHIGKVRLAPSAGLALRAYDVSLYAAQGDSVPLAQVHKATAGFSVMDLLLGDINPRMVHVHGAALALPCSEEGKALQVTEGNFSITLHDNELMRITSASLKLEGIPIRLRGSYRFPKPKESAQRSSGKSRPLDLAAELRPYQEVIDDIERRIAQQGWTHETTPSIELSLENEHGLRLNAEVNAPHFNYEQFRVRGARLNLAYQQDSILINNLEFSTVDPNSTVKAQGAYNIGQNRFNFSMNSTAALARMAEAFNIPEANEWLARYRHEDGNEPIIELWGDVRLEEDYSPKAVEVRGSLKQEGFRYGNVQVEKMGLSFFYRDGEFNISELILDFPEGSLSASASASGKEGKGRAKIRVNMPVEQLLNVVQEFTEKKPELPKGLELAGRINLTSTAHLSMPAFEAGQTDWRLFVPSLQTLELNLDIDKARYEGHVLEKPVLSLGMQGISHDADLIPNAVREAYLSVSVASASLQQKEGGAPVELRDAQLGLNLSRLQADAQDVSLGQLEGHLKLASLSMDSLHTEEIDLRLKELSQLRPLEENWRRMLQAANVELRANKLRSNDTLLGELDSTLRLDETGHIDLQLTLERENSKMELDLHPTLQEDGVLVLDNVDLELPAAGFEPLLSLADIEIPQIRMPEIISISGSARIDTAAGQLLAADASVSIPHLVRTPGSGNKVLQGKEIPLALQATVNAKGRENGQVRMNGSLTLTHKAGTPDKPDDRKMELRYQADTEGHIHITGTNSIDVCTIDYLIDSKDAHKIMRDFSTDKNTRTRSSINSLTIDYSDGLDVQADCELEVDNFGFQLGAVEDIKDARGKPTGQEKLRRDFGSNPYAAIRNIKGKVKIHRRKGTHDDTGALQPEVSLVTITDANITYDNRPWQRRKKLKGGPRESLLQGDKVIIDVENSFVEIVNVRGKVYPDYSLGVFYDKLHDFLDIFTLQQPASVETERCVFPIYRDCKRDMAGCIRMMARQADLHFLGTTFPLRAFSGFIWLREGSVYLDRLNAACWDGAINAAVNIDYSGKRTGFDGYTIVRNVNLRPLAAAYDSKQSDALCNGQIRFRTPTPDVEDIEAYGEVHIVNGDLMNMSIFRPVGELISDLPGYFTELEKKANTARGNKKPGWISRQTNALFSATGKLVDNVGDGIGSATNNIPFANHFLRYDLQEAHGHFVIDHGWLRTRQFHALGYNLDVSVRVAVNLDDLEIKGNIWPKISSVPTIILSPLTFLSRYVVDINVHGTVEDLKWRVGLDKRLQNTDAPESSASDKPANRNFKPLRP